MREQEQERWVQATLRNGRKVLLNMPRGTAVVRSQDEGGWFTAIYFDSMVTKPNPDPSAKEGEVILVQSNWCVLEMPEAFLPTDHALYKHPLESIPSEQGEGEGESRGTS